jgi:hypothetical protein
MPMFRIRRFANLTAVALIAVLSFCAAYASDRPVVVKGELKGSWKVPDGPWDGRAVIVYHHDSDGTWRVARDAWNSDLPSPTN